MKTFRNLFIAILSGALFLLPLPGNAQPVPGSGGAAIGTGGNYIGQTGSYILTPSANFTRPSNTTSYDVGDLIANSVTAGSVTPLSWVVTRVAGGADILSLSDYPPQNTALVGQTVRVHLHTATPTFAFGDNGASSSTASGWICDIDVTFKATAFTDVAAGRGAPSEANACLFSATVQTIYGDLEARTAFTPTSASVWTGVPEVLN